jgi:hypothetical protein
VSVRSAVIVRAVHGPLGGAGAPSPVTVSARSTVTILGPEAGGGFALSAGEAGGGDALSAGALGGGVDLSGGGASDETGPPPDEVPVKVIFGDVIGPVVEAESRGLAAPAPVNVIFGEVIGPVAEAASFGLAAPAPVNVIFGDVIGPVADAGSLGLAAPAAVNVIFGDVIVTDFAGVAGSGGFAGTPGFASGGLIVGVLIAGFCGIPCARAV